MTVQKFEYKYVLWLDDDGEDLLNHYGEQGWEATTFVPVRAFYGPYMIFKRVKQ